MSHNTIGLLKANGQIEEYGNTNGGGSDTRFTGTTAEWNALTTEQKALYEIVNFTDDSTAPEVVDSVPTQNSTHLVQSGGVWSGLNTVNQNFGTVELSSTAAYPHAVGETFINAAGQMVKCTAAIAVNDTIIINSNVAVTNVSSALSELNSNMIKNNFDSTLVDLTVYDDYDNMYIATADGYVRVGATETGLTGYTAVTIYGGSLENSFNVVCSINNPGIQWASNSMFVKKGMRMCCPEIAEGQQAIFLPLK